MKGHAFELPEDADVPDFAFLPETDISDIVEKAFRREHVFVRYVTYEHEDPNPRPNPPISRAKTAPRPRPRLHVVPEPDPVLTAPRLPLLLSPMTTYCTYVAVPPISSPSEAVAWYRAGVNLRDTDLHRIPYCRVERS